jgi:two-component system response regulator RegA
MANKILLVDDDVGILTSFKKLLERRGLQVDTAQSIEDAERQLKLYQYAAVIADLRLTGILSTEGLEIIKYIRDHHIDSRVILITGYGSDEVRERALQLGADFFFEKPVRAGELVDALASMGITP